VCRCAPSRSFPLGGLSPGRWLPPYDASPIAFTASGFSSDETSAAGVPRYVARITRRMILALELFQRGDLVGAHELGDAGALDDFGGGAPDDAGGLCGGHAHQRFGARPGVSVQRNGPTAERSRVGGREQHSIRPRQSPCFIRATLRPRGSGVHRSYWPSDLCADRGRSQTPLDAVFEPGGVFSISHPLYNWCAPRRDGIRAPSLPLYTRARAGVKPSRRGCMCANSPPMPAGDRG
jgi:hypothetical protein